MVHKLRFDNSRTTSGKPSCRRTGRSSDRRPVPGRLRPSTGTGRALLARWRNATGSDWKSAAPAGRTIAGLFPASRDQGPSRGLDLAGCERTIPAGKARAAASRPLDRLGLSAPRDEHPAGRRESKFFPTIEIIDRTYAPVESAGTLRNPRRDRPGRPGTGHRRQVCHAGDLLGRSAQRLAQSQRRRTVVVRGCARPRSAWPPPINWAGPWRSSAWAAECPMPGRTRTSTTVRRLGWPIRRALRWKPSRSAKSRTSAQPPTATARL